MSSGVVCARGHVVLVGTGVVVVAGATNDLRLLANTSCFDAQVEEKPHTETAARHKEPAVNTGSYIWLFPPPGAYLEAPRFVPRMLT